MWLAVEAARQAALRSKKEVLEKRLHELEATVKDMTDLLLLLCARVSVSCFLSLFGCLFHWCCYC